jgi:hypothetical protein
MMLHKVNFNPGNFILEVASKKVKGQPESSWHHLSLSNLDYLREREEAKNLPL